MLGEFMNIIKIDSIEYGWFVFSFKTNSGIKYIEVSDYADFDMPKYFLKKILMLVENRSNEESVFLMSEPGLEMLTLSKENDNIVFSNYLLKNSLYDANSTSEREYEIIGKSFELIIDKKKLLDNILIEFSLYEKGNGKKLYERNWMPFPKVEYSKIKRYYRKNHEKR